MAKKIRLTCSVLRGLATMRSYGMTTAEIDVFDGQLPQKEWDEMDRANSWIDQEMIRHRKVCKHCQKYYENN